MTAPLPSPHLADDRLDDYADGLLDAAARDATRAHLDGCAACAARLAELRHLLALSAAERRPVEPPAELWPLVVASTIEWPRLRQQVLRSMRVPLLVMAAILIALSAAATAWVVPRLSAIVHADAAAPSLSTILDEDADYDRDLAGLDHEHGPVERARVRDLRQRLAAADARLRGASDDEAFYLALAERERVVKEIRPLFGRAPRPPRAPVPASPGMVPG